MKDKKNRRRRKKTNLLSQTVRRMNQFKCELLNLKVYNTYAFYITNKQTMRTMTIDAMEV